MQEIKNKCEEEINTSAEREIKIFHGPFITFFFINDLLLAASYFRAKKNFDIFPSAEKSKKSFLSIK